MKKIIAFVLMAIMLFSIAACAEETKKENGNKDETVQTDGKLWDKHDLDFDGYEFVIMGKENTGSAESWGGDDLDVDELKGDDVIDEVYNRNRLIEQKYNCIIKSIVVADPKSYILAGDEENGNLISYNVWNIFKLVEDELLLDLKDERLTYLNLGKPWYNQSVQKDNEIAGKLYFINGDMLFTDDNAIWITLFNKSLAERYITDANLYDLVKEGKWTIDVFMKYAKLATSDTNGDDQMTYLDQWGYVGQSANVAAVVAGAGYRYAEISADGKIVANVTNPDFQNVFKKAYETVDKSFCIMATDIKGVDNMWIEMLNVFSEGRALFSLSGLVDTIAFREMETDFGILPTPKLTEEQEEYYSWVTMNGNVLAIPYYCGDFERTSAIVEALFEESSYKLKPAYIEKTLKYKSTRDEESIEMVDIIMRNTVYDIGVIYNFGNVYSQIDTMVINRSIANMSSTLKKNEPMVNEAIAELHEKFGIT